MNTSSMKRFANYFSIFFSFSFFFILPPKSVNAASIPWVLERDRVGLNMHWALGGFGADDQYARTIEKSDTTWVREHFSTEVLINASDDSSWFDRYDFVMNEYARLGVNVVGMLAYGPTAGDFQKPRPSDWELMIRKTVQRYGDRVKVWEVWNEPDSPTYLTPHNPETFQPIMEQAYDVIKEIQPDAIVLNGGLSSVNADFAKQMYENYGDSFDALAFHVYTCRDSSQENLKTQLAKMREVMAQYEDTDNAWVTEYGCSTGSPGISDERQRDYLQEAGEILFKAGWIERIFVYTIRDRDINDEYEDHFGLWDGTFQPHPAWQWYRKIPIGPYGLKRLSSEAEQQKAERLAGKLKRFFPEGIPLESEDQWTQMVNAWVYGKYPIEALVQFVRYGGTKAVHPRIPFERWRKQSSYKAIIAKDFVNGKPVFAYQRSRKSLSEERMLAKELKEQLSLNFDLATLKIDKTNWTTLVNAYVYGGYPIEAIARAVVFGGKTVHPTLRHSTWLQSLEYLSYIDRPIR